MNSGGAGDASGATYNGSASKTISYNTIGAPSTTGTNASGTWSISVTGSAGSATTATNATNVAVTTSSTASAFKVPFANTTASTTGNYGLLQDSEATFTYNPSTNTLTAGTFSGALSGNATTATTLQTARNINGVSFNGSADITIPTATVAGSNTQVQYNNSGNLGASSSFTWDNSVQELTVVGTVFANQFTSLSDRTKKTNIRTIENPVDIVKQLRGVRFDWIDDNKPSLGLIAQEVEEVLPELVEVNTIGNKSLLYGNIIGVLIEVVKEQQKQIDVLKREIDFLKPDDK